MDSGGNLKLLLNTHSPVCHHCSEQEKKLSKCNLKKLTPIPSMYKAAFCLSTTERLKGGWGWGGRAGHLFSSHRPLSTSDCSGGKSPDAKWPGTSAGLWGDSNCSKGQGWDCPAPTELKTYLPSPLVDSDQLEMTNPHSSPNCHLRRGMG
ncbi:hypothetical protein HJG60_010575 [Phyllostomus discolor]|uniref:Uncharacterized protein n=1 Tax=Phyllostomus discolor TaxID=89673 RepID=A0A834EBC6_9CHIR|nr:hypothetical protein HJG60_010575 [Phyllostomus discolor]